MAKRFFDTEIWQKEWFGELSPKGKNLVFFLLANCDCAGVYDVNYRNLKFYIGEDITEADILAIKQVIKLPNGKFFWTDFTKFQYGVNIDELNSKFSVHRGVIKILEKNNILDENGDIVLDLEQLGNSYPTVQNKDKDKDKDKDINKDIEINNNNEEKKPKTKAKAKTNVEKLQYGEFKNVLLTNEEKEKLKGLYGDQNLARAIETLSSYIESSGKKYKSHYAVLGKHNWVYQKVVIEGKGHYAKKSNSTVGDILRQAGEIF